MKYLTYLFAFIFLITCSSPELEKKYNNPNTLFSLLDPDDTGVSFANNLVEDEKNNHFINDLFVSGAGVAVGDINNDGLEDIVFTANQVRDRLYLNKGNFQFEDITINAGIDENVSWSTGVTMADVNNDGWLDIYICKNVQENEQKSGNHLYINNGDLTFTEKGREFGIADRGFSIQATFADFDKDGLLDCYIVNQPPSTGQRDGNTYNLDNKRNLKYTDRLYWNKGDNYYEDVTTIAGLQNLGFGLSATVGDFNNDTWLDIYVTNDFDRPDHLYINQKDGRFKNNINESIKHISNFSMGSDVADYDNDGLLDIAVVDMVAEDHKRIKTNMGGMDIQNFWNIVNNGWHYQYMFNTLQRNNGNGTFSELGHLAGISNTDWSWSPLFADFDNDGNKDLFITNGINRNIRYTDLQKNIVRKLDSLEIIAQRKGKKLNDIIDVMEFVEMTPIDELRDYAFKNNGDLTFSKKSKEWGFDLETLSYGASYGDFDNDGDLDLVINNMNDKALIYRNNSNDKYKYIKLRLSDENKSTVTGTRVTLFADGKLWQMQELTNARGYMSKSSDVLHFGLGTLEIIDSIRIDWIDEKYTLLKNVKSNQILNINKEKLLLANKKSPSNTNGKLFEDISSSLNLRIIHQENDFNDYDREVLLPHKMSNFGPFITVGDVNGDGREDFYIGGAKGVEGKLYMQTNRKGFDQRKQPVFKDDAVSEDMGSVFFDVDGDGDLDLFVVSGGNEFEPGDKELQDRLYINNGRGWFKKGKLPQMLQSGSSVAANDFDNDGDLDLLFGGRLVPGKYPLPASSCLLENKNGLLVDVTKDKAPGLIDIGLVTETEWVDINNDGLQDIVLVGEWMPITTLIQNKEGAFVKTQFEAFENTEGWYYSVAASDIDNDGDQDLVVGNLGLNYKYKASDEAPFEVYSHDFDGNGSLDIVLSYYEHGQSYPVRGRSCSSQQIPQIAENFPTFESFGDADLQDVYGQNLGQALNHKAFTFASAVVMNQGNSSFEILPLPNLAQSSSINNIMVKDFDKDGHKDLLISGNLYPAEIETPRNDAGMGMFLKGDGSGSFEPIPIKESGFFAPHDAKSMESITVGKDEIILVGNNKYYLQAIKYLK